MPGRCGGRRGNAVAAQHPQGVEGHSCGIDDRWDGDRSRGGRSRRNRRHRQVGDCRWVRDERCRRPDPRQLVARPGAGVARRRGDPGPRRCRRGVRRSRRGAGIACMVAAGNDHRRAVEGRPRGGAAQSVTTAATEHRRMGGGTDLARGTASAGRSVEHPTANRNGSRPLPQTSNCCNNLLAVAPRRRRSCRNCTTRWAWHRHCRRSTHIERE